MNAVENHLFTHTHGVTSLYNTTCAVTHTPIHTERGRGVWSTYTLAGLSTCRMGVFNV